MSKEPRLNYYYATVYPPTGLCVGVCTSITPLQEPDYIEIDSLNREYELKYFNYNDRKWYEDADFSIPWSPSK